MEPSSNIRKTLGILAFTQVAGWGMLYYAFSIMAADIGRDLQLRPEAVFGAFSWCLLVSGLAPHDLELEVTEGVIMAGAASTLATADALRARGVRLTIDDFGTGYSSLSSLRLLPLSKLKIDRSFVDGLLHEPSDASIIPAIIALARSLKLRVIAEGVETAAQLDYLQQHGCDEYQGHYASRAQSQPSFTGSTH